MTEDNSVYNPTTTSTQQPLPIFRTRWKLILFMGIGLIVLGSIVTFVGIWAGSGEHSEDEYLERTTNWLVTILGLVLFIIGITWVFYLCRNRPPARVTKARIPAEPDMRELQQVTIGNGNNTEEKANLMMNEAG